jgi:hypothetical protein
MKLLSVLVLTATCLLQVRIAAAADALWASDALTKVMRRDKPPAGDLKPALIEGARGEIASGQVVYRSSTEQESVTANITDLRHRDTRRTIPASSAHLKWVRYIDVTRNSAGIPADELVARAPASIPDPYWEDAAIPIAADQAQPLWIEVHVPRDAQAGLYDATLTVNAGDRGIQLPVALRVWDFEIPEHRHLSVVNWWSFPGLGFRDRVETGSEEYYELLDRMCRFLVEHRQTDINTPIGLIRESGNDQQGYTHDTAPLQRYAETAFQAGIRQIHLHSVAGKTANIVDPASRVAANEGAFRRLAALQQVIERRGWKRRFAVSITDEPFPHHEETYAAAVDRVHQTAPDVRCIEAVEAEYLGDLDIYVPKLSHLNLWYPHFDQVRRDGAELWFYTCCHPTGRYPNRFLDQSLLKTRVLHWINYLYDMDGYLHWGLNHFHGDDAYSEVGVSQNLPLGDRAIAYPGTEGLLGSLRFSALRDGLQDFEYLWVLEERLRKAKDRAGKDAFWLDPRQRPLELCRRVVWSFHDYTRDPAQMLATRRAIAKEIESLQGEPLLAVQTSPPEGTVVPAGPRMIILRGLTAPGATVTVNGKPVHRLRPSGYFTHFQFLSDSQPTVAVKAERDGQTRTAERTFKLED